MRWIQKFIIMENVELIDITDSTECFSFIHSQGNSVDILYAQMPPVADGVISWEGILVGVTAVSTRTYVGGRGAMVPLVKWIAESSPAPVAGQWAFDAFRILSGIPGAGSELGGTYTPNDAGLLEAVSFTKGCYIGQEVVARKETYRKGGHALVGIRTRTPVRGEGRIRREGAEIGVQTACSAFPLGDVYVGLAVVRGDAGEPGDCTVTDSQESVAEAVITRLPMEWR
jgi:folate-binding protein YgfZ